jgi:serine phosphatase RsbU (regulator of sigma subunit)
MAITVICFLFTLGLSIALSFVLLKKEKGIQKIIREELTVSENKRKELEEKILEQSTIQTSTERELEEKRNFEEENLKSLSEKEKLEVEKQKVDEKIKKLWNQSIAIHKEKERINELKIEVERKHKEVLDSINYAKGIQVAMLKSDAQDSQHLPKHFVLFKPRDVVSGDFYWSYEVENYWYVASVDCTGHGVPGAFLTMLGCAFLNEICSRSTLTPAQILDQLRDKIIKELSGNGSVKDGMDISICRININGSKNNVEVQWAGANNPLWYIQKDQMKEIKGDKQPIGYYEIIKPFTNHTMRLDEGDYLYLFTDGYADQFGGPMDKKFKYKPLIELVKNTVSVNMNEQKLKLNEAFENWKGEHEQTDDVCIVGIRI